MYKEEKLIKGQENVFKFYSFIYKKKLMYLINVYTKDYKKEERKF